MLMVSEQERQRPNVAPASAPTPLSFRRDSDAATAAQTNSPSIASSANATVNTYVTQIGNELIGIFSLRTPGSAIYVSRSKGSYSTQCLS
ncbi:MAG: hypothetical protein H6643_10665 [Caldilineaceae bacterium]|nr:hypothetical protein [Caldilineaceae bacterium]